MLSFPGYYHRDKLQDATSRENRSGTPIDPRSTRRHGRGERERESQSSASPVDTPQEFVHSHSASTSNLHFLCAPTSTPKFRLTFRRDTVISLNHPARLYFLDPAFPGLFSITRLNVPRICIRSRATHGTAIIFDVDEGGIPCSTTPICLERVPIVFVPVFRTTDIIAAVSLRASRYSDRARSRVLDRNDSQC